MGLKEYYNAVEALVRDLRASDHPDAADQIEKALTGGTTSGEILGNLSATLLGVATSIPTKADQINGLAEWAAVAFRS